MNQQLKAIDIKSKLKNYSLNEEDKFVFDSIDTILDGMKEAYPYVDRDYILSIFKSTSCNILNTSEVLNDSTNRKSI